MRWEGVCRLKISTSKQRWTVYFDWALFWLLFSARQRPIASGNWGQFNTSTQPISLGYAWLATVPSCVCFSNQNNYLISEHRLSFWQFPCHQVEPVVKKKKKNEPLFINLYLTISTWSTSLGLPLTILIIFHQGQNYETHEMKTQTDWRTKRTDLGMPRGSGEQVGWTGSVMSVDANYCI